MGMPNVKLSYGQTASEVNGAGSLDGEEVRAKANRTPLAISSSVLLDTSRRVEAGSEIKEENIKVGYEAKVRIKLRNQDRNKLGKGEMVRKGRMKNLVAAGHLVPDLV